MAAAEAAGIFRWNIIVDPGIGFAKARFLNLKLLRNLSVVKKLCQGLPLLVRDKFACVWIVPAKLKSNVLPIHLGGPVSQGFYWRDL